MNPFEKMLQNKGIKPGAFIPGMGLDQSNMEMAKALNTNGLKVRGQRFQSVVGVTEVDIKFSGDARLMVGFKIISDKMNIFVIDPTVTASLSVNNQVVLQDIPVEAFSPLVTGYSTKEWFEFVRSLSGSDNVKLVLNDNSVANYNIYFYYV
jgi:hypothetical protein